jgi:hypothetical protein
MARQAPPQRYTRIAAVVCGAAVGAALLERWWFPRAWGEQSALTSVFYYGDAPRLTSYAIAILKGQPFDNGIPFHPPGWPLVLASFLRAAGAVRNGDVVVPVAAVRLFLAATSAAAVGVTTLVAFDVAGLGTMLAVAVLGAFHFGHIVVGTVPNSEALYSLCIAAFMWTSWRWLKSEGGRTWAAASALVAGAALIVRAEFLAAIVVIAAAAWWRHGRSAVPELAAFAAVLAAALVPTTVWHWRTLSDFNARHAGIVAGPLPVFAPVTSYGPFNFAMANHADADGGPNRDHPMLDACNQETDVRLSAGELDLACPQVYDLYVHGYRIGAAWLLANPGDALALMARKASYAAGFLAHGYLIDDVGGGVTGVRRRVDMIDPDRRLLVPVHLLLLALGLAVLRQQREGRWILAAPLAAFAGATLLFYGYVRLGVAYLPPVWILEGAGLAWLAARAGRRVIPLRTAVILVLAGMGVVLAFEFAHRGELRAVALDGPRTAAGVAIDDETQRIVRTR